LDAEEAAGAEGSGTATPKVTNGKKNEAKDKEVDKAADDLKQSSLEDKKQEITA
jgi:hypothetical protein